MVKPETYKGIEFVQLSELPQAQQKMLKSTLNKNFLIKILVNGKILHDCLQFKDYNLWYESTFKTQIVAEEQKEITRLELDDIPSHQLLGLISPSK